MAETSDLPYTTLPDGTVVVRYTVKRCYHCIPLRIGSLILGYISLCTTVLYNLFMIVYISYLGVLTDGFQRFDNPMFKTSDSRLVTLTDPAVIEVGIVFALILIANVIWICIVIGCLVGAHKKRSVSIRRYAIWCAIYAIICVIVMIRNVTGVLSPLYINLGISTYFIAIYFLYTRELKTEREVEMTLKAAVAKASVCPATLDKSHLVANEEA